MNKELLPFFVSKIFQFHSPPPLQSGSVLPMHTKSADDVLMRSPSPGVNEPKVWGGGCNK